MSVTYEDVLARILEGSQQKGPRKAPRRRTHDWAAAIRKGLPANTARRVIEYCGLESRQVARILGASVRTLERATSARRPLSPVQSDRVYRMARIAAHAEEIFENPGTARDWLHRPNRALGGTPPLDLLDTDAGAQEVDDVLTRIEHGVFS